MRNALVCGLVVLGLTAACARPDPKMQPDPGQGYTLQTTGAVLGADDIQRNELDPTVGEVATRLASQICEREARCHGRSAIEDECLRSNTGLAALEVVTWQCSAAATRSRAKQCVAALNAEPCEMDLSTKPELCPQSSACPDESANLTSPGAVLAHSGPGTGRTPRHARRPSFDGAAAASALAAVDVKRCRDEEGPRGRGHIVVTFAPDGGVLTSVLDTGPDGSAIALDGTPRGQCVIEQFRKARIPVFDGRPVNVGATLSFE